MDWEGNRGGGVKVEGTYYQYFFSFIIKFSFDLNRRKREMGRGMVRGGVEGGLPWTHRGEMIRL